ncbi:MAG: 2TM domain-containing protein [Chitinophagaceae bacterium]|nr:MAG: 2TM domain-containing protein [Chitinophagaceae bacterium]
MNSEARDPRLWRIARRRASFRRQLATYLVVNAFFWAIWFFTGRPYYSGSIPWPIWPMLGWGIGIALSWYHAYGGGSDAEEREYERLARKRDERP